MPEKRRPAFAEGVAPNFYEWDAAMDEKTPVEKWKAMTARTLLVSDKGTTPRPIREVVEIFAKACPHWSFRFIAEGGHMAPPTHPELINPIVREFLGAGTTPISPS